MTKTQSFSLDSVRTDGWFERIGQGIGSFRALCDIIGERFFAFSMITGARITALTVDRRNPDDTLVDFVVGADTDDDIAEVQRLPLPDFRRRLVAALLTEGPLGQPPTRDTDIEALQLHIGVRYLLLAPLYGYSLRALETDRGRSFVRVLLDGREMTLELMMFQQRLRAHVREELDRAAGPQRSTIDLANVAQAEQAAREKDWRRVVQLLGSWPAPLAILLRTPEGQALAPETTGLIAKGLSLLATACVRMNEVTRAEEIFRLAVQYAQGGPVGAEIFARFGEAVLGNGRPGEAIGLLRRSVVLGASAAWVQPLLARALAQRKKYVAAHVCLKKALDAGVPEFELADDIRLIENGLGAALPRMRELIAIDDPNHALASDH